MAVQACQNEVPGPLRGVLVKSDSRFGLRHIPWGPISPRPGTQNDLGPMYHISSKTGISGTENPIHCKLQDLGPMYHISSKTGKSGTENPIHCKLQDLHPSQQTPTISPVSGLHLCPDSTRQSFSGLALMYFLFATFFFFVTCLWLVLLQIIE